MLRSLNRFAKRASRRIRPKKLVPRPEELFNHQVKIGLGGKQVERYYQRLKDAAGISGKAHDLQWARLRSYSKILSVFYEQNQGRISGKNVLEIGPGKMKEAKPLKLLREDGANVFSIEPEPSKELLRIAANAPDLFKIKQAHPGIGFDFVFSRGVFEHYSAKEYSGLARLEEKSARKRFLKELNSRMNAGATLVITEILSHEPDMLTAKELKRAGFEVIFDSDVALDRQRAAQLYSFGRERFLVAKKRK